MMLRTKARKPIAICIAGAFMLAGLGDNASAAQGDDPETAALLAELTKTSDELRRVSAEFPKKLESSLALKRQHEAEAAPLDSKLDQMEAAELPAIESQRPAVNAACSGTYPPDQYPAAVARCDAIRIPFNSRLDQYEARYNGIAGQLKTIEEKENRRIAELKEYQSKYESLQTKARSLGQAAILAVFRQCLTSTRSELEAASHAQSVCYDEASRRISQIITGKPANPPTSITPNRTPQQAIDDYRKSGAPQTTTQVRKSSPPPPPPPPPPPTKD